MRPALRTAWKTEAICLPFINRPKAQKYTPHLFSSPSLWGCAHPPLGVLREPFHVFPSVLEPVLSLLHGLQASLICKLWLMCTSIKNKNKNSALRFAKAQARHSIGAGMEGDMLSQCGVYHTYVQGVLPANHAGMPLSQHLPFQDGVSTIQEV